MRLLVCGGREFTDKDAVRAGIFEAVDMWYTARGESLPYDLSSITIIQGMARGADTLAYRLTMELGAKAECYPISQEEWDTLGHRAGPLRNRKMLQESKPDFGLIMNGGSGTNDMADLLRTAGIPALDKRRGAPAPTPTPRKRPKRLPTHRK